MDLVLRRPARETVKTRTSSSPTRAANGQGWVGTLNLSREVCSEDRFVIRESELMEALCQQLPEWKHDTIAMIYLGTHQLTQ